jgi:hypothetical protein
VGYLRLTPQEYRAVAAVCAALDLRGQHPPDFRRYLAECLEPTFPDLAERVTCFTNGQVRALLSHLRQPPPADSPIPLSAWEVGVLAEACGQLFGYDRFLGPLRAALVRSLRSVCPGLATRMARLTARQFERLWEEVRRRAGRES